MRYCQFLFIDCPGEKKKLKERICELIKYRGERKLIEKFLNWDPPVLPVTGHDLLEKNVPRGPVFQGTLQELKQIWKFSMFTSSREELLGKVDEIVEKTTSTMAAKKKKVEK